jgi:hypothetical protein
MSERDVIQCIIPPSHPRPAIRPRSNLTGPTDRPRFSGSVSAAFRVRVGGMP